jgi:hypothetical protein
VGLATASPKLQTPHVPSRPLQPVSQAALLDPKPRSSRMQRRRYQYASWPAPLMPSAAIGTFTADMLNKALSLTSAEARASAARLACGPCPDRHVWTDARRGSDRWHCNGLRHCGHAFAAGSARDSGRRIDSGQAPTVIKRFRRPKRPRLTPPVGSDPMHQIGRCHGCFLAIKILPFQLLSPLA